MIERSATNESSAAEQPQPGELWLVRTPTTLPDRKETFRAEIVTAGEGFTIRPEGKKVWPIIFGRDWFIQRVQQPQTI